jgi:hypothetical protein
MTIEKLQQKTGEGHVGGVGGAGGKGRVVGGGQEEGTG